MATHLVVAAKSMRNTFMCGLLASQLHHLQSCTSPGSPTKAPSQHYTTQRCRKSASVTKCDVFRSQNSGYCQAYSSWARPANLESCVLHVNVHLLLLLCLSLSVLCRLRSRSRHKCSVLTQLTFICPCFRCRFPTFAHTMKRSFTAGAHILHTLHCVQRRTQHLPVVLRRAVAPPLKLEGGITSKVFTRQLSMCFRPSYFPRVPSELEIVVALAAAEHKRLRVIAHKTDASARMHCCTAKPACLYPHRSLLIFSFWLIEIHYVTLPFLPSLGGASSSTPTAGCAGNFDLGCIVELNSA